MVILLSTYLQLVFDSIFFFDYDILLKKKKNTNML